MVKTLTGIAAVLVVVSTVGCGAPDWVRIGPLYYRHHKPNTLLFRGYSSICSSPREAANKAHANGAQEATDYIFLSVEVESPYPPDLQKEPGFDRVPGLVRQAVLETVYKAFDDPRLLVDEYTEKKEDRFEVTFATYHLYEIERAELADVIRKAGPSLELRVLKDGPGSTQEVRQKFANQSSAVLNHIAREILRTW